MSNLFFHRSAILCSSDSDTKILSQREFKLPRLLNRTRLRDKLIKKGPLLLRTRMWDSLLKKEILLLLMRLRDRLHVKEVVLLQLAVYLPTTATCSRHISYTFYYSCTCEMRKRLMKKSLI